MKTLNLTLRRARVRAKFSGSATRPRLSVHLSNRQVLAQLINDETGQTLAFSTSQDSTAKLGGKSMTEKAKWVGEDIGKKAKAAKVSEVVFDRGERRYHGRVQAIADAARKTGLKF